MNILVTNDDGIYSPGLLALADAAREFGNITIMAPDVERSSMGHAISSNKPISFKKAMTEMNGYPAFRVSGTPADCVALGTHIYANTELVLSGINLGTNLGNSIWHSGTLSAARQAVLFGLKGIAFSTPTGKETTDFNILRQSVIKVLSILNSVPGPALFNVNIPKDPQGILWTSQSVRQYDGKILPGVNPMGEKYYWFSIVPLDAPEEKTDRWAVEHGFVSITPLKLDITDYNMLKQQNPDEKKFSKS